jgi:hypothetical protein
MASGAYVGDLAGATSNRREDVLRVLDGLHVLWSVTDAVYGAAYSFVSGQPAASQIAQADLSRLGILAALTQNESATLNPAVASGTLGITLAAAVGAGQPNQKNDILLLQHALHADWQLTNADFTAQNAAVSAVSTPTVPDAIIGPTIEGIRRFKAAYAAGTSRRALLAGTNPIAPGAIASARATLVAPGVPVNPATGAATGFTDVVAGHSYEQDLVSRLDAIRAQDFPGSQALLGRRQVPMARYQSIADVAKQRVDAVYGRFASGPAFSTGGVGPANIVDRSDPAIHPPDPQDQVRYYVDDDPRMQSVRTQHHADNSAPPAQPIADRVKSTYWNRDPTTQHQLEVIDQAWPAVTVGGIVQVQAREAATPAETRREFWRSFQTLIHEYLHSITHPNYSRIAEAVGGDRAGVLIEGVTSLMTDHVWTAIFPGAIAGDVALRATVEGGSFPYSAAAIPPINHYAQIAQARNLEAQVGVENLRAAYFLGHTDLIGFPTQAPAPAAAPTASQEFEVPPAGVTSVADVARVTGSTADEIASLNGLRPDAAVRPGQKLRVPGLP